MASIWGGFNNFLRGVIDMIYSLAHSHGWAVVLFTLLIKLVLTPFDVKSRRSMRRMSALNPKIQALQKKYANDKEKLQQKQAELYKKEKINPLAGCLPMLLTMPVLFAMFAVMRGVANEELARILLTIHNAIGSLTDPAEIKAALDGLTSSGALRFENWLWIKNLWMADSPFASVLPLNATAVQLPVIAGLLDQAQLDAIKAFMGTATYQQALNYFNAVPLPGATVNLLVFQLTVYRNPNGYFVLPILAAVTQYLSTVLTPTDATQQASANQQTQGTGQMMKIFMPLFSLWICSTSNAAFSLYWVVTNIFMMGEQWALNMYFAARDRGAAGQPAKEAQ
ncbi:MAG: YidC/Oxa1 family membrane protein insertase [Oscillospiraceae bacterium]|nr:YidC/Oxa1 family membrane protein insertase [Oscillospiraceae bacterium]